MQKIFFNTLNKIRPIWRLILFILITFLINIPLQKALQALMDTGILRGILSGTIYLGSVIFSLYLQVKYFDKSSFEKYGLKLNKTWMQEFGLGVVIAAIQLGIFTAIMYATGNLSFLDFFVKNAADYNFDYSFLSGFLSETFSLLVGSSVEEIFFRAFLFYLVFEASRNIKKDASKRAILSLLIIAPFFGLAHLANEGATIISTINLGLDAIMICLPFLITGRLAMSIGMHFSWNFIQGAVLGFAISGNTVKASIFSSSMPDNLLTGGQFGPEGSIIFFLLDVIAVGLILYWKNKRAYQSLVNPLILELKN